MSDTTSTKKKELIDMAEADRIAKEEGDEYWEKFGKEIEAEKEADEAESARKTELKNQIASEKETVKPDSHIEKVEKAFTVSGVSLTDDQITTGKQQPVKKSLRWLVEWFIYEILKAHIIFKWIKGKFKRDNVV